MDEQKEQHQFYIPELISPDYSFAFDDPAFSDRVLKLLIFDDSPEEKRDSGEYCKLKNLFSSLKQMKEEIPESQKEYRVESLHICSLVLAAKSPFFHKLFTNGMKASSQHEVTMRIHSSEEAAFISVIKFIYNSKSLSADAPNALLEVLLTADKFCVPSCVKYCCKLLLSFPMTAELALCYIDLPSIISINEIQPLLNAAKEFLPNVLKDIPKYRKDIIKLSLEGIRTVLSRDDLKVDLEDAVYDLLVEWTKEHCLDCEEQRRVLNAEMFDLIRFQHMTLRKLKTVLGEFFNSNHLDSNAVTSMIDAIALDDNKSSFQTHCRAYKLLPVAVVTFKIPVNQCVVFLDLKREECKNNTCLQSQSFTLDENIFYLGVQRRNYEADNDTFGVFLHLKTRKKQSDTVVQFEFDVRQNSTPYEFVRRLEAFSITFKLGETYGYGEPFLFEAKWDAVMEENSPFFINGTLHLRAKITLLAEKEL